MLSLTGASPPLLFPHPLFRTCVSFLASRACWICFFSSLLTRSCSNVSVSFSSLTAKGQVRMGVGGSQAAGGGGQAGQGSRRDDSRQSSSSAAGSSCQ